MMIKKLLKFLIRVVDAELFESVEFENFKSGDVQNSDKKRSENILRIVLNTGIKITWAGRSKERG